MVDVPVAQYLYALLTGHQWLPPPRDQNPRGYVTLCPLLHLVHASWQQLGLVALVHKACHLEEILLDSSRSWNPAACAGVPCIAQGSTSPKSASRPPLAKKTCFLASRQSSRGMNGNSHPGRLLQRMLTESPGLVEQLEVLCEYLDHRPVNALQTGPATPTRSLKPCMAVTACKAAAAGSIMPCASAQNPDFQNPRVCLSLTLAQTHPPPYFTLVHRHAVCRQTFTTKALLFYFLVYFTGLYFD